MSASETTQVKSSATEICSFFSDPRETLSQNLRWYKGLSFEQRLHHHVYLLHRADLPYNSRRGHRNKVMSMISRLAKRVNKEIPVVLSWFKLSRGDLVVSKKIK